MQDFKPSYFLLNETGALRERIREAVSILNHCELCPRRCGVNRTEGGKGFCRSGMDPIVSSFNPHFGEESPLVGNGGSGAIFFTNCTLACVFCQNYSISQQGDGDPYTIEQLAGIYISLQKQGCENINFVTPTHFAPQILEALEIAVKKGFHLPLVYNTGGYERVEILQLLDGIMDIYLPDIKYARNEFAFRYSDVKDYVEYNRAAIKEMFRQVGILKCDERGVAQQGTIIRHLVLPEGCAGTEDCLRWLAKEVSPELHVALMSQYHPAHKAAGIPEIGRRLNSSEYRPLAKLHRELGFNGWIQSI